MFFFLLFALVLVGMYVGIRREMMPLTMTAALGTIGSILFMVLFMLGRTSVTGQAIVMGIIVGALFAGATIGLAWYFHTNGTAADPRREAISATSAGTTGDDYYE